MLDVAPRTITALRAPDGRPLRVLHVTTVDLSLALLLGTELEVLVRAGYEVHAASAPGEYVGEVVARGVRHHPLPSMSRRWSPGHDARAVTQLAGVVRRVRPDVLHVHTPKAGVMGRLVGRALGVPVVVNTCHGLWTRPDQRRLVRALVVTVEGIASLTSHAELYQNAEDAGTLQRWARGRQQVVGNGIDLSRFGPDPEARARLRREWGIADDEVVVGGVGRVVAEKGIRELAEAGRILGRRARVVWVGPADDDKADSLAEAPDGAQWLGPRADMAAVYNAFDVFALPSYREGFSRSGMEAAATGLPMVLTDIRGCREVGRHEEHLLLVPPRDAGALADALHRLVDDPALRLRLGAAARARALDEFDQVAVAARSLEAYADVARRRGLPWVAAEAGV